MGRARGRGEVAFFARIGGFVFGVIVTKVLSASGQLAVPLRTAR